MTGENLMGEGEEKSSISKAAIVLGVVVTVGAAAAAPIPPLAITLAALGIVMIAGGAGYEIGKKVYKSKCKEKDKKAEGIGTNLNEQTRNLQKVLKSGTPSVEKQEHLLVELKSKIATLHRQTPDKTSETSMYQTQQRVEAGTRKSVQDLIQQYQLEPAKEGLSDNNHVENENARASMSVM